MPSGQETPHNDLQTQRWRLWKLTKRELRCWLFIIVHIVWFASRPIFKSHIPIVLHKAVRRLGIQELGLRCGIFAEIPFKEGKRGLAEFSTSFVCVCSQMTSIQVHLDGGKALG